MTLALLVAGRPGPISINTVLERMPLRELPLPRPAASCFEPGMEETAALCRYAREHGQHLRG